jgi:hypothetical protein
MREPYSNPLINYLHAHLPELLYRPTQFQTVQDVLTYVITVARRNPYEEELAEYDRTHPRTPPPTRTSAANTASIASSADSGADQLYRVLYGAQLPPINEPSIGIGSSSIFSSRSIRAPSRRYVSPLASSDPIMSFLGELIGGSSVVGIGTSSVNIQSFLDQPVPIRPTQAHIDENTILITVNHTHPDNCAICQDPIEEGQTMRILNYCMHPFHQSCIDTWFQSHVTCPTCRHDIRET